MFACVQDEGLYEVSSEVRGQLKVLESIDRLSHRRKMEKEKDQILKAAKSRSRPEDPEAAAKIKEQAKKVWVYTLLGGKSFIPQEAMVISVQKVAFTLK